MEDKQIWVERGKIVVNLTQEVDYTVEWKKIIHVSRSKSLG